MHKRLCTHGTRPQAQRQQANAEVNYLAMGLVPAFTAIAVVNTLAMSVAERVREFVLLRLDGAIRRQVLRMPRTEAPSVTPLVYLTVVAVAGTLALVATALPGRVALQVRAATVATARE